MVSKVSGVLAGTECVAGSLFPAAIVNLANQNIVFANVGLGIL